MVILNTCYLPYYLAYDRADVKGGLDPPLWSVGPPTANDPYHKYAT